MEEVGPFDRMVVRHLLGDQYSDKFLQRPWMGAHRARLCRGEDVRDVVQVGGLEQALEAPMHTAERWNAFAEKAKLPGWEQAGDVERVRRWFNHRTSCATAEECLGGQDTKEWFRETVARWSKDNDEAYQAINSDVLGAVGVESKRNDAAWFREVAKNEFLRPPEKAWFGQFAKRLESGDQAQEPLPGAFADVVGTEVLKRHFTPAELTKEIQDLQDRIDVINVLNTDKKIKLDTRDVPGVTSSFRSGAQSLSWTAPATQLDRIRLISKSSEQWDLTKARVTDLKQQVEGSIRVFLRILHNTPTGEHQMRIAKERGRYVMFDPRNRTDKTELGDFYSVSQGAAVPAHIPNDPSVASATTEALYEKEIKPAMESLKSGNRHVAFFGYGFSGSGKTYNLLGKPDNPGVLPRAIVGLSPKTARLAAVYELYYEIDILESSSKIVPHQKLIRWLDALETPLVGNGDCEIGAGPASVTSTFTVSRDEDPTSKIVQYVEELAKERAKHDRIMTTPNNSDSSRSHLLMTFELEFDGGEKSYLSIFDMAGAELPEPIAASYLTTVPEVIDPEIRQLADEDVRAYFAGQKQVDAMAATAGDAERKLAYHVHSLQAQIRGNGAGIQPKFFNLLQCHDLPNPREFNCVTQMPVAHNRISTCIKYNCSQLTFVTNNPGSDHFAEVKKALEAYPLFHAALEGSEGAAETSTKMDSGDVWVHTVAKGGKLFLAWTAVAEAEVKVWRNKPAKAVREDDLTPPQKHMLDSMTVPPAYRCLSCGNNGGMKNGVVVHSVTGAWMDQKLPAETRGNKYSLERYDLSGNDGPVTTEAMGKLPSVFLCSFFDSLVRDQSIQAVDENGDLRWEGGLKKYCNMKEVGGTVPSGNGKDLGITSFAITNFDWSEDDAAGDKNDSRQQPCVSSFSSTGFGGMPASNCPGWDMPVDHVPTRAFLSSDVRFQFKAGHRVSDATHYDAFKRARQLTSVSRTNRQIIPGDLFSPAAGTTVGTDEVIQLGIEKPNGEEDAKTAVVLLQGRIGASDWFGCCFRDSDTDMMLSYGRCRVGNAGAVMEAYKHMRRLMRFGNGAAAFDQKAVPEADRIITVHFSDVMKIMRQAVGINEHLHHLKDLSVLRCFQHLSAETMFTGQSKVKVPQKVVEGHGKGYAFKHDVFSGGKFESDHGVYKRLIPGGTAFPVPSRDVVEKVLCSNINQGSDTSDVPVPELFRVQTDAQKIQSKIQSCRNLSLLKDDVQYTAACACDAPCSCGDLYVKGRRVNLELGDNEIQRSGTIFVRGQTLTIGGAEIPNTILVQNLDQITFKIRAIHLAQQACFDFKNAPMDFALYYRRWPEGALAWHTNINPVRLLTVPPQFVNRPEDIAQFCFGDALWTNDDAFQKAMKLKIINNNLFNGDAAYVCKAPGARGGAARGAARSTSRSRGAARSTSRGASRGARSSSAPRTSHSGASEGCTRASGSRRSGSTHHGAFTGILTSAYHNQSKIFPTFGGVDTGSGSATVSQGGENPSLMTKLLLSLNDHPASNGTIYNMLFCVRTDKPLSFSESTAGFAATVSA